MKQGFLKPFAFSLGKRLSPKPGNVLLPTFALCDVNEISQDVRMVYFNQHRFVCELSQHVLYHYVFIITWFCMIFGIILSLVGLLMHLGEHVLAMSCCMTGGATARSVLYHVFNIQGAGPTTQI